MKKSAWKKWYKQECEAHAESVRERNNLIDAAEASIKRINTFGGDSVVVKYLNNSLPLWWKEEFFRDK